VQDIVALLRGAGCVFAEEEAELLAGAARSAAELDHLTRRRVSGEPLELVVGWARFAGLRVTVAPGVFVPRRRTEFLARAAIERCPPEGIVVDMCCGAGAIGAAVAAARPGAEVHATDIDPVAVACANANVPGRVYQGDLFGPLPADLRGRVDVLVVNPPYVPTGQVPLLPAEAREHEPLRALDGGADGLDVLRRVAREAPGWLAAGGHLLAETSQRQADRAVAAIAAAGLTPAVTGDADLGATVVIGRKSPAHFHRTEAVTAQPPTVQGEASGLAFSQTLAGLRNRLTPGSAAPSKLNRVRFTFGEPMLAPGVHGTPGIQSGAQ
jgi:release factor glutamine methyltransferase